MKLRMNPVYKKELKLSVRTMKIALIIFFYNGVLATIGLLSFYFTFSARVSYGSVDYSDVLSVYLIMSVIQMGLILFVVPAFTAGAIAGEREKQTLEILLTTKLKPMQIILGKLASSISTVLLLVFSSLPVLSIIFTVGGIGIWDLVQLVFLILILAIFIGSMGIFFSTLFKRTVPATVFTYGSVLFVTLGTFFLVGIIYLFVANRVESQYNMYMGAISYQSPDIGNSVLILLMNPILTMIAMMTSQYGNANLLIDIITRFGNCNSFILDHWFWCSVAVQLLISICFIFGAAKLLNPLKRKNIIHKKEQRKK